MDIENESKNEFDYLLLSSARQGDVDKLKGYLFTVSNPDFYLDRIYDETDNQKCTLLMIACLNGHTNIFGMILHHFKPDLEVLNNIVLEEKDIKRNMSINVTVLWTAATLNNFSLVKLLVEHGANVNHTTKTNSTPLRGACYNGNVDMARYLVENGADKYVAKENNNTNLILSVGQKHLNMVNYLVNELNYDVNSSNKRGRSPLYYAVFFEALEIVEFLLNHGARNFPAIIDQMSPLMWAAEKRREDLVQAISLHCSLLEQIEADELLGSAYIYFERINRVMEQAFTYFHRALELRLRHDLPKALRTSTIEIFDNRQECQTLEQLEEIRSNTDSICTEALLIRERLLGPGNAEYHHSLYCRGRSLAKNSQYQRTIALWMHELDLYRQYSIFLDSNHLRKVISLFAKMLFEAVCIPIDVLIKLLRLINEELDHNKKEFDNNLYSLLFLITIISQILEKTDILISDRQTLYRQLHTIIQHQYTTYDNRWSLLHLSLNEHTSVHNRRLNRICKYPCYQTVRLLLQCDADVNAIDIVRNTPLHVLISNKSICNESTLKILCDTAGAHLDYVNALGEIPIDLTSNPIIKQLLKRRMKLSLKCLCARIIQQNGIPFHEKFATTLVKFVEQH